MLGAKSGDKNGEKTMKVFRPFSRSFWPNMVMVSGSMRSGTTILQRVLATSSDSNGCSPEFNAPYFAFSSGMKRLSGKKRIRENIRKHTVSFWKLQGRPKLLIAKDPMIAAHIDHFVALTPTIRHVISVRDPRDVPKRCPGRSRSELQTEVGESASPDTPRPTRGPPQRSTWGRWAAR